MEHVLSKDGTVIGFDKSGSGPPLLLVHGTTADHTRWATVSPLLARHFTVYAMDRRGRGASTDSPDYDLVREAEDVAAVVNSIGASVSVLGHSHGGLCSLEGALLTQHVRRLILYEPPVPLGAAYYPTHLPSRMNALIDRGELEAALELFFHEVVRMPDDEFEMYRRLPVWKTRVQLAPTVPREMTIDRTYRFIPEKFVHLQVPTLLLLGAKSPPKFRQATELVDSTLPNSRILLLPGQQHIAMDTDPEMFATEVRRFLLDQPEQTASHGAS